MTWTLLQNSLLVSFLSTLMAVALGAVSALFLGSIGPTWRRCLLGAAAIAFALPPFLVTNCWLYLLGHTGVWRTWFPGSIYSLWGTIWILGLLTWPITLFLVLGSWRRLEPSQLECEPNLRGWPLIRWLLLPLAMPAIGVATVLTFVLTLNNFAVPSILQTKVYAAELWLSFSTTFDYGAAVWLSWPLVAAPVLLLVVLKRREFPWPAKEGGVSPELLRLHLGPAWFWASAWITTLLILVSVVLPLAQLLGVKQTWTELPKAYAAAGNAMPSTFLFAALASTASVALGLIIRRWRVGSALWLPFLAPGVLLGIALIYVFNRPGLSAFYSSAGIVILGFVLRYVALSRAMAARAMRAVDRDLADSARLLGASTFQLFGFVQWPQIAPAMAAVGYITYLLCLWDVETLVLVVPPGGETLALRVFNLLHYGHNDQVNALCALLLGLALLPLLVWSLAREIWIRKRRGQQSWFVPGLLAFALVGTSIGCSQTPSGSLRVESQVFASVRVFGTRGTGPGQFNKPRSLAVDAADNLYVVDMTGRVQKFTPDGVFVSSWQMPQTDLGKPKGMCRDSKGRIVVIEPHYSRVNHFSTDGQLAAQWGDVGIDPGQLMFPRAAVVNSRGDIYVSEYGKVERVQKFSAQGPSLLQAMGRAGSGEGQFNRPEGLGIDRQDHLYVADSCNHRIQVFSDDGKFLRAYGKAGHEPGDLSYPYDIQVDQEGRQYVCEFGNSRIQIFDRQGRTLEILGGPGSAPGQFNNPWGLALDSRGNLYVADALNHRVQKFLRKNAA